MISTFRVPRRSAVLLLLGWVVLTGSAPAATRPLKVTTTTSMVTDLVRQIGGDRIEVQGLMGAGVDPHLYKATASDVIKLQRANVIFYNGLTLEGKMEELFVSLARAKKPVYTVTEVIAREQLLKPPQFEGHYDPHVWFEVPLWAKSAERVVEALSSADPEGKAYYEKRGAELRLKLDQLHQWALKKAAELPQSKRILVTSHDAFNYFGRAYGFQVVGLQGISTVTEAGLADMAKLVDFIKENKLKAVFIESSVPPTTIERIAKDAGVKVGGELFSDAMGVPGEKEGDYDLGTYEGMIKHNLNTIVNALK